MSAPSGPSPPLAPAPPPRGWRWPRFRMRPALGLLACGLAFGLWQSATLVLELRAEGSRLSWSRPFSWEITGALAGTLCMVIPLAAVLNTPRAAGWRRFVGVHLAAFALFTVIKNPLMIGARLVLYPLLGWGSYRYGMWPLHLAMESMKDAISYSVIAAAFTLYHAAGERQAQALREAALAGELKEAKLQALTGQLNPHFLMNALNTVSSVMYEDLARTDRLLSDLGQVLRASFDSERATWSLGEERAHTERFVALLQARFGERLGVAWELEPGLERVQVPRFAFQLLVENAVKHNQDRAVPLRLRIGARTAAGGLLLEVEDDGRGFGARSPARGAGLGLRHLEEALRLLHGADGQLVRAAGAEGGARVSLRLPLAEAEGSAGAAAARAADGARAAGESQ